MTPSDEMTVRRIVREELEAFFAARDKAKMPESCPDFPYSFLCVKNKDEISPSIHTSCAVTSESFVVMTR